MKVHIIEAVYKDGTIATIKTTSYIKLAMFKSKLKQKGLGNCIHLTIDGKIYLENKGDKNHD